MNKLFTKCYLFTFCQWLSNNVSVSASMKCQIKKEPEGSPTKSSSIQPRICAYKSSTNSSFGLLKDEDSDGDKKKNH